MTTGEARHGRRRLLASADRRRRATFPALVAVLALFCIEGLQLLSSVVRNDLASPPLVEVPAIDLGAAPAPRLTKVAGKVVEAEPSPLTAPPTAPPTAIESGDASEGADPALAPRSTEAQLGATDLVVTAAALPPPVPAPVSAGDGGGDARRSRPDASRRRSPHPAGLTPQGPPPGRPVGPECDAVPGRRAACDRRPPIE